MKKTLLKSLALAAVGSLMVAGSALALPLPSEWGVVNPSDITTEKALVETSDFGYSIWTDDLERTSWHIRWTDGDETHNSSTFFSGLISLQNNTGSYADFNFTTGQDLLIITGQNASWFSFITQETNGINFTIAQITAPSYVGFQLNYMSAAMDANFIYLGTQTVASLGQDHDFSVTAPVPEPATMFLFGTGLAGLAGIARRRKKA